jgi:hypothetical protein
MSDHATAVLLQLKAMIISPTASDETKALALTLAYQLGKSDGTVEGAQRIADHINGKLDKMGVPA